MRFLLGVSLFALAACSAQAPAPEQTAEPATPSKLSATQAEAAASDLWLTGVDLPAYLDCAREQGVTLLQAVQSSFNKRIVHDAPEVIA